MKEVKERGDYGRMGMDAQLLALRMQSGGPKVRVTDRWPVTEGLFLHAMTVQSSLTKLRGTKCQTSNLLSDNKCGLF